MKNRRAGRFGLLFLWSYAQIAGPYPAAAPCAWLRALPPPPRPAPAAAPCLCRRVLRPPPRPAFAAAPCLRRRVLPVPARPASAGAPCVRRRALPLPPRPASAVAPCLPGAPCLCRRALRLPPRPASAAAPCLRRRFFLCGCGAHPGRGQCTRFKKTLECSFLFRPLAPAGRFLSAAVRRMTPENVGAIKTKYQQMYFLVWSQNEQAYKMSMNHINIFHNFFTKKS